jgi:hypothetical protein
MMERELGMGWRGDGGWGGGRWDFVWGFGVGEGGWGLDGERGCCDPFRGDIRDGGDPEVSLRSSTGYRLASPRDGEL